MACSIPLDQDTGCLFAYTLPPLEGDDPQFAELSVTFTHKVWNLGSILFFIFLVLSSIILLATGSVALTYYVMKVLCRRTVNESDPV